MLFAGFFFILFFLEQQEARYTLFAMHCSQVNYLINAESLLFSESKVFCRQKKNEAEFSIIYPQYEPFSSQSLVRSVPKLFSLSARFVKVCKTVAKLLVLILFDERAFLHIYIYKLALQFTKKRNKTFFLPLIWNASFSRNVISLSKSKNSFLFT